MYMTWQSLLFMHWRVPTDTLRPLIPEHFEIDTFDGSAWIGLIPFTMRNVRPAISGVRVPPVPTMHHFHECNVRTYITRGEQRGVWFFSLDAASKLAVIGARRLWNLNYIYSDMSLCRDGETIHYEVKRKANPATTMRCAWRVGDPLPQSQPGELAHFLTERYALFTVDRRGRPKIGCIRHEPWSLYSAEVLELDDHLVSAAEIDMDTAAPPTLHYAEHLEVQAWPLHHA